MHHLSRPGTGLGTFRYTKTKKYQFSTDFSHNFVVDLLSDTGLISTSLFLSFLIIQLSQSVSKIRKNLRNDDSVITLVFLVGLVGLLINNMVDFDLQIISVGLLFWIFIGMINFYNQKNDINLEKNN
jgi:O-antigen ligase